MRLVIHPGRALCGETRLPGDKSISHRAALFAALAVGQSRIENFLVSGVTQAMLEALSALSVHWELRGDTLGVRGQGLLGLRPPARPIDCGNSATTLRLLAGALAASGLPGILDGSPGLRRRPMDRIVAPLRGMGVPIAAMPGGHAPLTLFPRPPGQNLQALDYHTPVASAQVKSCLLLAALAADGPSRLTEPARSRDHTERILAAMGVAVQASRVGDGWQVALAPSSGDLKPLHMAIPGDFSAAAFLIVAAAITPGSVVVLRGVGLNPTRTGLLTTLQEMGADIRVSNRAWQSGEPVGDLVVRSGALHGVQVDSERAVAMIDEFPAFAVAAACARGRTEACQAVELRVKETDRIAAICQELRAQGVPVEEKADGFVVEGNGTIPGGGMASSHGDHRLAMALAVAGLAAQNPIGVASAEVIGESYPGFADCLRTLGAQVESLPDG